MRSNNLTMITWLFCSLDEIFEKNPTSHLLLFCFLRGTTTLLRGERRMTHDKRFGGCFLANVTRVYTVSCVHEERIIIVIITQRSIEDDNRLHGSETSSKNKSYAISTTVSPSRRAVCRLMVDGLKQSKPAEPIGGQNKRTSKKNTEKYAKIIIRLHSLWVCFKKKIYIKTPMYKKKQ